MPTVSVSPFGPKPQFVDAAGNPLVGGKMFFYMAGSTSTKQNTYTDSTGTVANANPIILNALGEPPTELWFTQGQLYKVVLAPATDTDPPSNPIWSIDNLQGASGPSSVSSLTTPAGRVLGYIGTNNSSSPLTQYDMSAVSVTTRNSLGQSYTFSNTGVITNNLSTAGPIINGRDQTAAFPINSWVYLYFISNGTNIATISSLTAPPNAPALPTGYTTWAFAGAYFWNSSSNLLRTRSRGSYISYDQQQIVLNAGGATTETSVTVTNQVPSPTVSGRFDIQFSASATTNVNGTGLVTFITRILSGSDFSANNVYVAAASSLSFTSGKICNFPNVSQTFLYLNQNIASPANVATVSATIYVSGYGVFNGDC